MLNELMQIELMSWLKVLGFVIGWWIIVALVADLFASKIPDEFQKGLIMLYIIFVVALIVIAIFMD